MHKQITIEKEYCGAFNNFHLDYSNGHISYHLCIDSILSSAHNVTFIHLLPWEVKILII